MDRRIEKTQIAIFTALISLMKEKRFEKITINEIANLANVNRGTIYFHYLDKYDILDKCIDSYLKNIFVGCSSDTPENLMYNTFNYIYENKTIFSIFLSDRDTSFFRKHLLKETLDSMNKQVHNSKVDKTKQEFRNYFLASAFVGMIEWWINNSMILTPKEMVDNFTSIYDDIKID